MAVGVGNGVSVGSAVAVGGTEVSVGTDVGLGRGVAVSATSVGTIVAVASIVFVGATAFAFGSSKARMMAAMMATATIARMTGNVDFLLEFSAILSSLDGIYPFGIWGLYTPVVVNRGVTTCRFY